MGPYQTIVLWAAHKGRSRINYFELGLHFTEEWHTYELETRFEDDSTDITLVRNEQAKHFNIKYS